MKTKSIKIDEELHTKIKIYCAKNKIKMNKWIEEELDRIIEKIEK